MTRVPPDNADTVSPIIRLKSGKKKAASIKRSLIAYKIGKQDNNITLF